MSTEPAEVHMEDLYTIVELVQGRILPVAFEAYYPPGYMQIGGYGKNSTQKIRFIRSNAAGFMALEQDAAHYFLPLVRKQISREFTILALEEAIRAQWAHEDEPPTPDTRRSAPPRAVGRKASEYCWYLVTLGRPNSAGETVLTCNQDALKTLYYAPYEWEHIQAWADEAQEGDFLKVRGDTIVFLRAGQKLNMMIAPTFERVAIDLDD